MFNEVVEEDVGNGVDFALVLVLAPKLALLLGSMDSRTFGNTCPPPTPTPRFMFRSEAKVDATDEAAVDVEGRPPRREEDAAACNRCA